MEILAVRPKVFGQVIDPGGEEGDLDLARSGVLLVDLELIDNFLFCSDFCHGLVWVARLMGPLGPWFQPVKAGATVLIPRVRDQSRCQPATGRLTLTQGLFINVHPGSRK